MSIPHPRGRGRGNAADVDDVLDRHRHAVQRSAIAARGEFPVRLGRLAPRLVRHHVNERVQPAGLRLDAPEALVRQASTALRSPARSRRPKCSTVMRIERVGHKSRVRYRTGALLDRSVQRP